MEFTITEMILNLIEFPSKGMIVLLMADVFNESVRWRF